ncbi:FeoB-associated Cys-rich membrane protein [Planctomycetota bacterium]
MENILVIIIVSAVSLWALRSAYRILTGRKGCSCSGSCDQDNCDQSFTGATQ